MRQTLLVVFFLAGLPAQVLHAAPEPSFQCSRAKTAAERLICSNPSLAKLDRHLAQMSKNSPASGREGARAWLRERDECVKDETSSEDQAAVHCVQSAYLNRMLNLELGGLSTPPAPKQLDALLDTLRLLLQDEYSELRGPLLSEKADAIGGLVCRLFERAPRDAEQLFASFYGSNMDNFFPLCREIDVVDRIPELKPVMEVIQTIVGIDGPCAGSIRFAYGRNESVYRTRAALDSNPAYEAARKKDEEQNRKEWGYLPTLEHWALQGNWEKRQYAALLSEQIKARPAVSSYYSRVLHLTAAKAESAADALMRGLVDLSISEHMGASSTLAFPSLCWDLHDLDTYLESGQLPERTCAYQEFADMSRENNLARLLALAIVNNRPLPEIERLMNAGASLKVIKNQGALDDFEPPAILAVPRPEVLRLLLDRGADANGANAFGKTALMYAAQDGNLESVRALLDHQADPNRATIVPGACYPARTALRVGGRTALMYGAWQGTPEVITELLARGSSRGAQDTEGKAAVDYLPRNGNLSAASRDRMTGELRGAEPEAPQPESATTAK